MVKERNDSGTYTVQGLILNREKSLNTEVRVTGHIQRKYVCMPEKHACDTPTHAVLVDDLSEPSQRLIVVGGKTSRFSELKEGDRVTLDAMYALHDPSALFVRTEGVLILPHIEPPPPAPTP